MSAVPFILPYTPSDWYWLASDGRVFASARSAVVDETDMDYLAWSERGGMRSIWPSDETGAQTAAALDDVLRLHGLSTSGKLVQAYGDDLIAALTDAELTAMSGGTMRDQRMLSAQRAPFTPGDDVIVRLAAVMKIDPKAWFARLGVSA